MLLRLSMLFVLASCQVKEPAAKPDAPVKPVESVERVKPTALVAEAPDVGPSDAEAAAVECETDEQCVLSRLVPDGEQQCCQGCTRRALTTQALQALVAMCATQELPENRCAKKKCVPRRVEARCVDGHCQRVSLGQGN